MGSHGAFHAGHAGHFRHGSHVLRALHGLAGRSWLRGLGKRGDSEQGGEEERKKRFHKTSRVKRVLIKDKFVRANKKPGAIAPGFTGKKKITKQAVFTRDESVSPEG
jgi:hypothetical protein